MPATIKIVLCSAEDRSRLLVPTGHMQAVEIVPSLLTVLFVSAGRVTVPNLFRKNENSSVTP